MINPTCCYPMNYICNPPRLKPLQYGNWQMLTVNKRDSFERVNDAKKARFNDK